MTRREFIDLETGGSVDHWESEAAYRAAIHRAALRWDDRLEKLRDKGIIGPDAEEIPDE